MTPGARVAAAIEVLDAIQSGSAAEQALLRWARASRFAGSKDRAAVRDHVFDALRHWRSDPVRGGGTDGRARMIGRLRGIGADLGAFFHGEGHAPAPLSADEQARGRIPTGADGLDVPDWLWPHIQDLAEQSAEQLAQVWQTRAPVTLRVQTRRMSLEAAQAHLEGEGISARPNERADTAMTLEAGARRLKSTRLYQDGIVELQDASSQAVVAGLPCGQRVLDYCAGGGGKALALAAEGRDVTAHDIDPKRMSDLPDRAKRAQTPVTLVTPDRLTRAEPFDLVLCDAPCSGSGAWRRSPEGKWTLTPERLAALNALQLNVLEKAASYVAHNGTLAYATCSVLPSENETLIAAFQAQHPEWQLQNSRNWPVDSLGDGFFTAHLTRG